MFTCVLYWDKFQSMLLFVFAKNFHKHMESASLSDLPQFILSKKFCERNGNFFT